MTFNAKKSARAGLRNVCAGLGLCLICCAWSLKIVDTDTNVVLVSIRETNTHVWQMEYSLNQGRYWTWCLTTVTGTVAQPFYKCPPNLLVRARLVQ